jgi:hypothetical protein
MVFGLTWRMAATCSAVNNSSMAARHPCTGKLLGWAALPNRARRPAGTRSVPVDPKHHTLLIITCQLLSIAVRGAGLLHPYPASGWCGPWALIDATQLSIPTGRGRIEGERNRDADDAHLGGCRCVSQGHRRPAVSGRWLVEIALTLVANHPLYIPRRRIFRCSGCRAGSTSQLTPSPSTSEKAIWSDGGHPTCRLGDRQGRPGGESPRDAVHPREHSRASNDAPCHGRAAPERRGHGGSVSPQPAVDASKIR